MILFGRSRKLDDGFYHKCSKAVMSVKKITGIIGSGMIGTDPYEENAWSGSSKHFFLECSKQGILHRAFGVEVNDFKRIPLTLKNFSFNRNLWKQKFYLDTQYYSLLTRMIINKLSKDDLKHGLLQIGGIFSLKKVLKTDCSIFSYHDGNLAQTIKSPYFPKNISDSKIQKALDYEKAVYENIDRIFTMSNYLKHSFVNDFNIDEAKVKVIGAGINIDVIPTSLNKNYEKKNLLFIGADFFRKGGMDLLRAFKIVHSLYPEARLNIVGPRNLEIPYEYCSGVIYHGFLSKKKPVEKKIFDKLMNDSAMFIMPSLYEPFGIAPLEAMVYEIPCILTDAWAFPEMVEPGINGELVKCGDSKELTEKIICLLENPDRLQSMGRAGRERVLREFTWQSVVSRLSKELSAW